MGFTQVLGKSNTTHGTEPMGDCCFCSENDVIWGVEVKCCSVSSRNFNNGRQDLNDLI